MKTLKNIEMFNTLSDEELTLVQELCHPLSAVDEEELICEDQMGEKIFILISGRIDIVVNNPVKKNEHICLAKLKPYESFGEFSIFGNSPRSASAISQGPSELLKIDSWDLSNLMDEYPVMGMKLMRNLGGILCTRLRNIDMEYRNANLWVGI